MAVKLNESKYSSCYPRRLHSRAEGDDTPGPVDLKEYHTGHQLSSSSFERTNFRVAFRFPLFVFQEACAELLQLLGGFCEQTHVENGAGNVGTGPGQLDDKCTQSTGDRTAGESAQVLKDMSFLFK